MVTHITVCITIGYFGETKWGQLTHQLVIWKVHMKLM